MAKRKVLKEGPYVETARAKKLPGKTVRRGGVKVLRKAGKKPIGFIAGGLHAALGVTPGKKIPASKMMAAKAGKYGAKAKKQALFAENVLVGKGR